MQACVGLDEAADSGSPITAFALLFDSLSNCKQFITSSS